MSFIDQLLRGVRQALLPALLTGLVSVSPASLTAPLTVEELSAVSSDIVQARVVATASDTYRDKIITRTTLQVMDTLKGSPAGEMQIVTIGGQVGPLALTSPGAPTLLKGEEVILFLSHPYDRLSPAEKARKDPASPVNQSAQMVGGYQGKFTVRRETVTSTEGGHQLSREVVRVVRGTTARTPQGPQYPLLEDFKGAVRQLVAEQQQLARGTTVTETAIPAVRGKFVVPRRSTNAAIRIFDPLPEVARQPPMTVAEYRRRQAAQAQQKQAHQAASTPAPEAGKKE